MLQTATTTAAYEFNTGYNSKVAETPKTKAYVRYTPPTRIATPKPQETKVITPIWEQERELISTTPVFIEGLDDNEDEIISVVEVTPADTDTADFE